jgi:alkanesulfonate monooxygenase SsuD/methylene tetrahydromethanopterin reductase-like flavin-dependent oxidoreductase (luciferase family)
VDLGVHLPLIQFGDEPLSARRLYETVDSARECGFGAVSANDHFVFQTPWLDGLAALASVVDRSGEMELATTIALAVLRGPVRLAKALVAIDILSEGRVVAGVGPGSSARDYELIGVPFEERWKRFDETLAALRPLLGGDSELEPGPWGDRIPLWIGSWGSDAGLARVAKFADGWLASAYNTTPVGFADARAKLSGVLEQRGRDPAGFPNAVATMWTWVSEDKSDRTLEDVLAPMLRRDPTELGPQVCVGPPEHCAELLARYADAGCERIYIWPLGDERRQLELIASARN